MYPAVIKIRDLATSVAAFIAVIVMWLLSQVLIQTYVENGRSVVALICVILLHIIIVPAGLFFFAMIFNPPTTTLSPEGIKVKIFPRTRFYKWSEVEGDLKISNMPGWPKFTNFHYIAFGEFESEAYLVPLRLFTKWSKTLKKVEAYRAAALKSERI